MQWYDFTTQIGNKTENTAQLLTQKRSHCIDRYVIFASQRRIKQKHEAPLQKFLLNDHSDHAASAKFNIELYSMLSHDNMICVSTA